jgi:hypothetical protein
METKRTNHTWTIKTANNISLTIVGRIVVVSTLEILSGFCLRVGLIVFKCPTLAKP